MGLGFTVYVCMCMCECAHTYVCVHASVCTHAHAHSHIQVCVHECVCVRVCVLGKQRIILSVLPYKGFCDRVSHWPGVHQFHELGLQMYALVPSILKCEFWG